MREELPKYCRFCGAELVWGKWDFCGYQQSNGLKRSISQLICPKNKWFQLNHRHPLNNWAHRFFRFGVEFEPGQITVVDSDGKAVAQ